MKYGCMINRLAKTDSESKESYLECEWEVEHMLDVNIVFLDNGILKGLWSITFTFADYFSSKQLVFFKILNSLSPYVLVQF